MSCDRCKDIHTAQLSGMTGKACECSCHGYTFTYPIWCDDTYCTTSTITCSTNGCLDLNLNNQ